MKVNRPEHFTSARRSIQGKGIKESDSLSCRVVTHLVLNTEKIVKTSRSAEETVYGVYTVNDDDIFVTRQLGTRSGGSLIL